MVGDRCYLSKAVYWGLRVHLKGQKTREGGWRRAKEARKKRPKTGKKQMKVIENK